MKKTIKKLLNQKVTIFFILLASLMWFLNRLNRKFTTEIPIHIEIVEDYNSKVWLENNIIQYKINAEADGKLITLAKLGLMPNLKINASSLKFLPRDNYVNTIEPNSLKHAIQQKFSNLTVNYIIDSLNKVIVSPLIEAKIPIKSNIHITCQKQFMILDSVRLSFDSVSVKAPRIVLDTMKFIPTELYEKHLANSTLQGNLDLIVKDDIIVEQKSVGFTAEIVAFTEIEIELPIKVKNNTFNEKIVVIPKQTSLKAHIPLDKYNSNENVSAFVDLNKKRQTLLLEVFIDSLPKGSRIISLEPNFVETFYN